MSTGDGPRVVEVSPQQAWDRLSRSEEAVLIDVRTRAEWLFVGGPDISELDRSIIRVEWAELPAMSQNPRFVDQVLEEFGGAVPSELYFLCRSGGRSMSAAKAVARTLAAMGVTAECVNVAEGFEGDLDPQKHRGGLNGWKARGLPWTQS